jgi:hypothetical protein
MEDQSKELAIKKKAQKDYPDFTDSVDGLGLEDLKKNMVIYSQYREDSELAKQKDEGLKEAKDNVKFLSGPYNDTIKALKTKLAYLNLLAREKQSD